MFGFVFRLYREIGVLTDRELTRVLTVSSLCVCIILSAWMCLYSARSGAFDSLALSWGLLRSGSLGGFVHSLFDGGFPASSGTFLLSLAALQVSCLELVRDAVTEALDAHVGPQDQANESDE